MTGTPELVDEDISTIHSLISLKPVDVIFDLCINVGFEINTKKHKFNVGNHVKILNYKNIFKKCYYDSNTRIS